MMRPDSFRAGQRVRIRPYVDSDFAGYQGVILYVGDDVCDVKIKYRPKGSKISSSYIGTFKKDDLETINGKLNLTHFSGVNDVRKRNSRIWMLIFLAILLLLLWAVIPGLH